MNKLKRINIGKKTSSRVINSINRTHTQEPNTIDDNVVVDEVKKKKEEEEQREKKNHPISAVQSARIPYNACLQALSICMYAQLQFY